jgi:hypothetical protein
MGGAGCQRTVWTVQLLEPRHGKGGLGIDQERSDRKGYGSPGAHAMWRPQLAWRLRGRRTPTSEALLGSYRKGRKSH